eukprot:9446695-Alexandrium_andersonii.AAC.1
MCIRDRSGQKARQTDGWTVGQTRVRLSGWWCSTPFFRSPLEGRQCSLARRAPPEAVAAEPLRHLGPQREGAQLMLRQPQVANTQWPMPAR